MTAMRVLPDKLCERPGCGKTFSRHRMPGGRLIPTSVFLAQRFCSIRCGAIHQGPVSKRMHHLRAMRYLKDRCEDCGVTAEHAILHVHHLDGDYTNDDPSNYRTLCAVREDGQRACHVKRHDRPTWYDNNRQLTRKARVWRRRRKGRAA